MRIALLNLPVDNNYGGNLQRYALMKVLQDMGHEVTHLNLRFNFVPRPWYVYCCHVVRRIVARLFTGKRNAIIPELRNQWAFDRTCSVTDLFYKRYVKHTKSLNKDNYRKYLDTHIYDAYIAGSDQIWRKSMTDICYGLSTFFFDFLRDKKNVRRIVYGASFGSNEGEFSEEDIAVIKPLYSMISHVSLREKSGIDILKRYGFDVGKVVMVLDPTLLLSRADYIALVMASITQPLNGEIFCYVLDSNNNTKEEIEKVSNEMKLKPFEIGVSNSQQITIEQWLRYFMDAKYVITDSYHGMVFSIIFEKPFKLLYNSRRGNSRFASLLSLLEITDNFNWNQINERRDYWKNLSLGFLKRALQ